MILLLDTAKDDLNIGLLNQEELIINYSIQAKQKQSELILSELDRLFKEKGISPKQLEAVTVTIGPGSFTGLRISLTVAKVICTQLNIPLYTINTLLAMSKGEPNSIAIMDARSQRAYIYKENQESIVTIQELTEKITNTTKIYGDAGLVGKESEPFSIIENMAYLKKQWQHIEDPSNCKPHYLKETSAYGSGN